MIWSLTVFITFTAFIVFSFLNPNNNKSSSPTLILKGSSFISFLLVCFWFLNGCPCIFISLNWFNTNLSTFYLSFIIDQAFTLFLAVALFVTWSIIEFSTYYMNNDPNKQSFLNTLILFLFFMLILVSSNNLFLLFVGWEGVGILSFILIGWWFTRADANSAAIQAIIYNRIGDSGMLLFLVMSISITNSWNLLDIILLEPYTPLSFWAYFGIIIAAAGKSAQFGLHPWLPAAMEGPTPVSALLHSSTMVVAGVFLLYRCSPILSLSPWPLPLIAIIGSLTALFAASAALTQYDIKKVVAYSTTSQLGLMVVAVGLGIPNLALFHICTHAFFKSLLFLCSGSLIHNLNNEQDLRKMSNSFIFLPFTTSCLTIGSVALCGFPFLAGYYSKDLILEASQTSLTNSLSIILALIATLMTAIYSFRILFFLNSQNLNVSTLNPINESNNNLFNPLLRLVIGVIASGWLISTCFMDFSPIIIPLTSKSLPIILTIYSALYIFSSSLPNPLNFLYTLNVNKFLANNWFFVNLTHGNISLIILNNSLKGILRILDQGWLANLGATGISSSIIQLINVLQNSQTGNIAKYLTYFTILLISIIIII
uniref:NADH-ubiquinone oxidoreductase chain 5 n=1 Tax=Ophiotreta durbanensis TaxID=3135534 RepID=A0AAU6PX24_9ECHI